MTSSQSRFFLAVIGFAILLQPMFAMDGKSVIEEDSMGCLFLNVKELYFSAIEKLKTLNAPENALIKASLTKLWETAAPNFIKARGTAMSKSCTANMYILLGAVEMYNMENVNLMKTQIDIPLLKEEKYLSSDVICKENGKYSLQGDFSGNGKISCSIHGPMANLRDEQPENESKKDSVPSSLEDFAKKILDFDSKGLFKPTGGLWVSVNQKLIPRLVLEATIKPSELYEFFLQFDPTLSKPSKVENYLQFELPPPRPRKRHSILELNLTELKFVQEHNRKTI
ncbi:hypothetical protein HYY75_07215 [bacterium]|nr:hypothetical protein [bacterium]